MKITRRQLRRIIKEELSEVGMGAAGGAFPPVADTEINAETEVLTGPPSGAEDIGEVTYQLGRHFSGALADRAETLAQALRDMGLSRAAENLMAGSRDATMRLEQP